MTVRKSKYSWDKCFGNWVCSTMQNVVVNPAKGWEILVTYTKKPHQIERGCLGIRDFPKNCQEHFARCTHVRCWKKDVQTFYQIPQTNGENTNLDPSWVCKSSSKSHLFGSFQALVRRLCAGENFGHIVNSHENICGTWKSPHQTSPFEFHASFFGVYATLHFKFQTQFPYFRRVNWCLNR